MRAETLFDSNRRKPPLQTSVKRLSGGLLTRKELTDFDQLAFFICVFFSSCLQKGKVLPQRDQYADYKYLQEQTKLGCQEPYSIELHEY